MLDARFLSVVDMDHHHSGFLMINFLKFQRICHFLYLQASIIVKSVQVNHSTSTYL